ncbi:glycosyltransferase family 4 protein [Larsenimonas suaedae]|uniref:Glycosyltransferase family 4 protein n=1 Tax=Larsenimonas suaedae TaxID=1851019 RepID=A0ABU1GXZ0_9GAMM|nr:glycosyltransferase family 4 protein [Larsenimonas suaedae]MCM2972984.1 glycosyltransferase family 4 protein [Larsenimonas suaedae]MDR5896421.1 glycosyltransferase family 4 protein [Larsenimonas suaedae]
MSNDAPSPPRMAHLVSLKNLGGVERYFLRFVTEYKRAMALDVLLQTEQVHPFLRDELSARGYPIHNIKGPSTLKLPELLGLRGWHQKTLIERIDPQAILVWNKLAGNPLPMLERHPVFHYEHGTSWTAPKTREVDDYLERLSGVVAVSHAAYRMLQLRCGLSEHVPALTLHNAIEVPERIAEHAEGRFRLGFAGRLKGLKAPMVALETFRGVQAELPEAELWIAGEGPLEPVLREWVERWQLQDNVRFCGLVNDMSAFYTELDVFICPSWREPFGLVAQEAMAYGLPTLVSNVDGLPEALMDAANGAIIEPTRPRDALKKYSELCVQGPSEVYSPSRDELVSAQVIDPEEAAQILIEWANDAELRRRIGQRARAQLMQEQNLTRYGDRLIAFIKSAL